MLRVFQAFCMRLRKALRSTHYRAAAYATVADPYEKRVIESLCFFVISDYIKIQVKTQVKAQV